MSNWFKNKKITFFIKNHDIGLVYNEMDPEDLALKIKKLIHLKMSDKNIFTQNLGNLSVNEFNHENNYI